MRFVPIMAAAGLALAVAGCAALGQDVRVTSSIASTAPLIPDAIPGPPLPAGTFDLDRAPEPQKRVYSIDPDSPDFWYPHW